MSVSPTDGIGPTQGQRKTLHDQGPISLFEHVSGDIILFVSSKRRRLEARNFAVILIFIPFTTYEKTSFTESAGRSSRNGISGPNGFPDFEETGPRVGIQPTTFGFDHRCSTD